MQRVSSRILFIDAYDSFSNNIISLLETTLACSVRTVKIDDPILLDSDDELREELRHYDAVVCGPGPGTPENAQDVGIFKKLWQLNDDNLLPVLGICLGFQSLCLEFGGKIKRLKGPQHGIIRRVTHIGEGAQGNGSIFEGVAELTATHYQSLCADIGQDQILSHLRNTDKWKCSADCPDLLPLAYAESDLNIPNLSGIRDERVLVAVQHNSKPFFALQYHPESICTEVESHKVIANWFEQAQTWNQQYRKSKRSNKDPPHGLQVVRPSLLSQYLDETSHETSEARQETICYWEVIDLPLGITVVELADEICVGGGRIVLESTNTNEVLEGTADVRGRFSIIALGVEKSSSVEYHVGNDHIFRNGPDSEERFELGGASPWAFVAQYMKNHCATIGPEESPFWGGMIGYTTYELGLESIKVESTKSKNESRPDMCLAWVVESLVVDHRRDKIYLQHLGVNTTEQPIRSKLQDLKKRVETFIETKSSSSHGLSDSDSDSYEVSTPFSTPPISTSSSQIDLRAVKIAPTSQDQKPGINEVKKPLDMNYEAKVVKCQSYISAGDSYELCLTDQTTVSRPKPKSASSSWDLYLTLRARQPAPFSSFISLRGATLVSSSPERFLTWDSSNHCSLRPMKGTVRKSPQVNTLEKARALLDVPKEKAENLMIVDLVRHDLHGICGSGNVQVPRLCVVEEYKSVYQMISVVEGQIPPAVPNKKHLAHTGLDVLAASLPPGSMTGAPKKRSCEILQEIEEQERSLYSGVVGYIDVRGSGDWSVTIRSMFKWDDEDEVVDGEKMEKWHIGAGGAVTTLSTAVGEREEMNTKLTGTLGIFL